MTQSENGGRGFDSRRLHSEKPSDSGPRGGQCPRCPRFPADFDDCPDNDCPFHAERRRLDKERTDDWAAFFQLGDALELADVSFVGVGELTEEGASFCISCPVEEAKRLLELIEQARAAMECAECGAHRSGEPVWLCSRSCWEAYNG